MTIAVVCLSVIVLALLVLWRLEQAHWQEMVVNVSATAMQERASLLERIQHPERVRVEAGPPVVVEVPRDAGELAMVGFEVPGHVHVGSNNGLEVDGGA